LRIVSVPEKEKKRIIWTFMEELIENYENAKESNVQADFRFMDFFNFGNLTDGFSEEDKVEVIKQFAKEEGYIKIKGDTVKLTEKGVSEARKGIHRWDAEFRQKMF
jgi:hypothetical protein